MNGAAQKPTEEANVWIRDSFDSEREWIIELSPSAINDIEKAVEELPHPDGGPRDGLDLKITGIDSDSPSSEVLLNAALSCDSEDRHAVD